jgi:hypothetical protein
MEETGWKFKWFLDSLNMWYDHQAKALQNYPLDIIVLIGF